MLKKIYCLIPFYLLLGLGGCAKKKEQPGLSWSKKKNWPPAAEKLADVATTKLNRLMVTKLSSALESDNPYSTQWKLAPYFEVPLQAQQVTMPQLTQLSIPLIKVQALTDGRQIAWRLSWTDPTPDGNVDVGRFCDAAAIQFPLTVGATPMMGLGGKVQILQWKAIWQKDLDVGFQDVQDVQDVHPNFWSDLYWFAEGKFPYPIPESFQNPKALTWFVALQAGNPLAAFSRTQPIQELVAEGYGTLTNQPVSHSSGKGVWMDNRWAVVFVRPLLTEDPSDFQFKSNQDAMVAFAVWQGSDGNVGGRKQWSNWITYKL